MLKNTGLFFLIMILLSACATSLPPTETPSVEKTSTSEPTSLPTLTITTEPPPTQEPEPTQTPLPPKDIKVPGEFSTIQQAINASKDGDTVIVSPGVYGEIINFKGKDITVRSETPDDPYVVETTIIDGEGSGSVVTFESGETQSAVLEGFTIRNGLPKHLQYGGGILIRSASPIIRNNVITSNGAEQAGGGIFVVDQASPLIVKNVVTGNMAAHRGGGIDVRHDSSPEIRENEITNNVAELGAGLEIADNSSPIVVNNVIDNNAGGSDLTFGSVEEFLDGEVQDLLEDIRELPQIGAGIYVVNQSSPVITGNMISDNLGGAVAVMLNSSGSIEENTIEGNTGGELGAGVLAGINSSPEIMGNTIRNNTSPWSGGIEVFNNSSPTIQDNIIENNTGAFGAGIYIWQNSRAVVVNNILRNNNADGEGGPIWIDHTSAILDEKETPLSTPDKRNTYEGNIPSENYIEPTPPLEPAPTGEELKVPEEFFTIQQAVDASENGDTIVVSPGTYQGGIDFDGKNITIRSEAPQDPDVVAETVVDLGMNNEIGFHNRETRSAKLEGFTIINGDLTAIIVDGSSPTIANNIIRDNPEVGISIHHGSSALIKNNSIKDNTEDGIECRYSNPIIQDNTILNNGGGITLWVSSPSILSNEIAENVRESKPGGGIFHDHYSRATVQGNVFRDNEARAGGAIYCDHYSCETIADNIIVANRAPGGSGGGIFVWGHSTPMIVNNLMIANEAEYGGAINCFTDSSPTILHNTISGNVAVEGGGVATGYYSTPTIVNSILWGNTPDQITGDAKVSFSDIQDGYQGEGNIDIDPIFLDPAREDYHLSFDSPAIDAGTDVDLSTDFEGDSRPFDGDGDNQARNDMGADEWTE